MAKKPALGKGIASLLQSSPNERATSDEEDKVNALMKKNLLNKQILKKEKKTARVKPVKEQKKEVVTEIINEPLLLDVSQIAVNPSQPRKIFKEDALLELSQSIKENGILQPILVTRSDNGFEVIAGERRLRATKLAGLEKIPAIIKQSTDKEKMIFAILENVQRTDLNCVEEALAYFQLMEDFHLTQEEVAKKIGKERSTIANYLRILKLPRAAIELMQTERLTFGHAKVLAAIQDRERAVHFAILAAEEQLSVRELEKLIKKAKNKGAAGSTSKESVFNDKLDGCRQSLENRTGFHFHLKAHKKGHGDINIKFANEKEFNSIFEFLMQQ